MYANVMRLVKDVEVKTVNIKGNEKSVCNNRVAISTIGNDLTTYINVTAWGGLAELMGQYLKKGDEFYAEGELKNDTMQVFDESGEKKELQSVYLLLDSIKFTHGNRRDR